MFGVGQEELVTGAGVLQIELSCRGRVSDEGKRLVAKGDRELSIFRIAEGAIHENYSGPFQTKQH